MSFADWVSADRVHIIIAGGFGGVIRALTLKEDWRTSLISVVSGAVMSAYLTPVIGPIIDPFLKPAVVELSARNGLVGFLIGMGGMIISGFVIDMFRQRRQRYLDQDKEGKL